MEGADTNDLVKSGLFDISTFHQILEMDDDPEERDFSKSIVTDFFEQAETTFDKMDDALKTKDLPALSALGHFLKGSSATLGLTKVKDQCEKIQHLGAKKDVTGEPSTDSEEQLLSQLKEHVDEAKTDFEDAKALLEKFFGDI